MAIKSSGIISIGGTHDGTDGSILNEKQQATTARTNVSLKGLSVDGVADSSGGDITGTPDGSTPYKMSEFHGYSQFYSSTFSGYSTNSGGKANITRNRTTLANSTAVMSDGTFTIRLESQRGGASGIRIVWGSSALSTGWTTVTIAQSGVSTLTINRASMSGGLEAGEYTHLGGGNLTGSGTGSITFS